MPLTSCKYTYSILQHIKTRHPFSINNITDTKVQFNSETVFVYKFLISTKFDKVFHSIPAKIYKEIVAKIHEAVFEAIGVINNNEKFPVVWNKEVENTVKKNNITLSLIIKDPDEKEPRKNRRKETDKKIETWNRTCEYLGNHNRLKKRKFTT